MNNTNRAMNRTFLALAGVILIGAGILVAAAGLSADVRTGWTAVAGSALTAWQALRDTAPSPEPLGSWWSLAVPAVLLLAALTTILWLARQAGGRTRTAAREDDPELGATAVEVSYLAAAVEAALEGNRSVVGSSLTAWRRRGSKNAARTSLRLTLQARRGASPREVADVAEELVRSIDALLGHHTDVLVRIGTGTRTKLARALRAG
ncbi:hypothetical protein DC347_12765 [Pseudarthrobacter sp. AG30]|nr:hypothetical protein DC347_12765 [Pseudarthrobacter sp. AG30]